MPRLGRLRRGERLIPISPAAAFPLYTTLEAVIQEDASIKNLVRNV